MEFKKLKLSVVFLIGIGLAGLQAQEAMTHSNRTALDAVSGTNTGDQDLSSLAGIN